MNQKIARPFLKWAGGKVKLAEDIASRIGEVESRTYFEPFLGGASVFFALQTSVAVLSDENQELINTYRCIQSQPTRVHRKLRALVDVHSSEHYYLVRDLFNKREGSSFDQAARFIYLNKAGFNGVYRVNTKGCYNVPSGKRSQLAIPTLDELTVVSRRLKGAALIHSDFEFVVAHAVAGDVIYLDPPYPPISDSSFFTHYTADRFTDGEQKRVANVAKALKSKGCKVVISNADTPSIRELYRGWITVDIELRRWITAGKTKHFVKELLFLSKE